MTQAAYHQIVEQMWLDQRTDLTEVATLTSL